MPTKPLKLIFGVHNHQPVGNFGHVFEEVFERCYRPYFQVLNKFPSLKTCAHFTGPLLEWLDAHHPEFLDELADMAESNQLELLGGGFYEPLLATLPEKDAIGQLRMMNDYLEKRMGVRPRGFWLAERIWSPAIPKIAAQAGLEFTVLDDTHFFYGGLDEHQIHGHYITEHQGSPLKLFPILKSLRYAIPFEPPEDMLAKMKQAHDAGNVQVMTYADDGEKFGSWPDTFEWVYEKKYLERLFAQMEEAGDWLKTVTFTEALDSEAPLGRVYLPPASYDEMMEWALPSEKTLELKKFKEDLKSQGQDESVVRMFLRGGQWDQFLTKYEESNLLHKKMLYVSRKVGQLDSGHESYSEIRKHLYQGQCNCAYWHGMFGGLYLNYLRHALYSALIEAEAKVDCLIADKNNQVEWLDYDLDGKDEVIVSNQNVSLLISPHRGACLMELDFRPLAFNLSNVLKRQKETYHQEIVNSASQGSVENQPQSIHDHVRVKEEGLENHLFYDRHPRFSFLDHCIPFDTPVQELLAGTYTEWGDFVEAGFENDGVSSHEDSDPTLLAFCRLGEVQGVPVTLNKTYEIKENQAGVGVSYSILNGGEKSLSFGFGVEFNWTLLAGHASDRRYELPGGTLDDAFLDSMGCVESVSELSLVDDWSKLQLGMTTSKPARWLRYPVETVSQSEGGLERTYQGSCLWLLWQVDLAPGDVFENRVELLLGRF